MGLGRVGGVGWVGGRVGWAGGFLGGGPACPEPGLVWRGTWRLSTARRRSEGVGQAGNFGRETNRRKGERQSTNEATGWQISERTGVGFCFWCCLGCPDGRAQNRTGTTGRALCPVGPLLHERTEAESPGHRQAGVCPSPDSFWPRLGHFPAAASESNCRGRGGGRGGCWGREGGGRGGDWWGVGGGLVGGGHWTGGGRALDWWGAGVGLVGGGHWTGGGWALDWWGAGVGLVGDWGGGGGGCMLLSNFFLISNLLKYILYSFPFVHYVRDIGVTSRDARRGGLLPKNPPEIFGEQGEGWALRRLTGEVRERAGAPEGIDGGRTHR